MQRLNLCRSGGACHASSLNLFLCPAHCLDARRFGEVWLPKSEPGKSIKFEPKGYTLLVLLKSHPSETLLAIQAWERLSP
jgi:hypothetical protein